MYTKIKYLVFLTAFLAWPDGSLAQKGIKSISLWKLNSLSGEAKINGLYREEERAGLDSREYQHSSYLSGGLFLKSSQSILHPDFLVLDISAGYMPETNKDNFIIIPDQAEVRTLKKLGIGATFLQRKKTTLHLIADFDESYSSRENLTDVKSVNNHWGGSFGYSNKILPLSIDFYRRKWNEEEILTARKNSMVQNVFGARTSRSFTSHDRNELRYTHDENTNVNQNFVRIANATDYISFESSVTLDSLKRSSFNSLVSSFIQHGNLNFNRFQAGETISLKLPLNFTFFGNYNFFNIQQDFSGLLQHSLNANLMHQLYKSLQTRINFDFNTVKHTVYQERNFKTGFDLNYTKKIPGGQLLLSYQFDRYHQSYNSGKDPLFILNEQYQLSDNKIILLRLPDVATSSVILRDATGTILYENGLDYILLQRGRYIEIRRIPGGSIPNSAVVLIDYTAEQPGLYKYDANTHVFTSSIYLFKNKVILNYRFATQDYSNLEQTELVTLNYFTQNVAGCRLDLGFINVGAEYETYNSSILPFRMTRYYANFQKTMGKKLTFQLNGNFQDYVMLDSTESKYQKYLDATGKITYSVFKQTNLNLDLMYRKQSGRGIDLDLLSAKFEVTSSISRLFLSIGAIIYRRNYVGEKVNFKGTYIKIVRKF